MTPEEKREQLLKRILPALVVLVIYFVFISGIVSEDAEKARTKYDALEKKGISAKVLPGLMQEQSRTKLEIGKLGKEHEKFRQELTGVAGFLTSDMSEIESMQILSEILAQNRLLIIEEKSEKFPSEQLPLSIREIKHWLQDTAENETRSIRVEHLKLTGGYRDMYTAMLEIASGRLSAIPVQLTMSEKLDETGTPTGELHWELVLWM